VYSVPGVGLFASISEEKWEKAQGIIRKLVSRLDEVGDAPLIISHKELEQDTGFLVHLAMTFDNAKPLLKGSYNILNSWRWDRNEEGWKRSNKEWKHLWSDLENDKTVDEILSEERSLHWKQFRDHLREGHSDNSAPAEVLAVPRFALDVKGLSKIFSGDSPARRLIRGERVCKLRYKFGDASGAGFGSSWIDPESIEFVSYRFGRWGSDMEDSSSNFREARNLKEGLDEMERREELEGCEVYIFTDNSTAEAAFYKGSSTSPLLFELALELKAIEMRCNCRIHVIHVAGTRMIRQGTDDLSRGVLSEGVMQGDDMLRLVPLNKAALEREKNLKDWLMHWLYSAKENVGEDLSFLEIEDWFTRGHDIIGEEKKYDGLWIPELKSGNFVWTPPPALALPCLEELRKARHKRQTSTPIFLCARLMTPDWIRQLHKSADLFLELPAGYFAWSESQHEPLILGIFFSFIKSRPWQLKTAPAILELGRKVQQMWKKNEGDGRFILREFCNLPRRVSNVSEHLVSKMLRLPGKTSLSKKSKRERRDRPSQIRDR